jgi:3-oxoacyl-[acyl-carrier-protein] synthase II
MSGPAARPEPRRVVITGMGVVTPIGVGRDAFWSSALEGRSGLGRPSLVDHPDLPVKVVAEVKDFDPSDHMATKVTVRTDRNTHFAFAACAQGLADAGLDLEQEDSTRVGLVMASNYGGLSFFLNDLVKLHQKGPSFVSAYMAIAWIPSAPVGQLSIKHKIHGYAKTIINDAAGGTDAIGTAYRAVRRGDADVIIAGGFEAAMAEAAIAGLAAFDQVCKDAEDPAAAFRPFNVDRPGIVIGEGGGIVILEELERAQARGAHIYGEIVGFAMTSDAMGLKVFDPEGAQYARAMSLALEQGGLSAADVDYVNADGRGTQEGDRSEANALARVFGEGVPGVAVSAPKSMVGNTLAGAGAIDLAFTLMAMRDGTIAPTINLDRQDPECAMDLVTGSPRETPVEVALVGSRGTTGVNAALAVRHMV